MKCYIDEFFVENVPEENEIIESALLLFGSGDRFEKANKDLLKLDCTHENCESFYGIRLTRMTKLSSFKSDYSDYYIGNRLDGGLNGNWITVNLKELLKNARINPNDNQRILSFTQNNIDGQGGSPETLTDNFEGKIDIDMDSEFTIRESTPVEKIEFNNLDDNSPRVTLLFAGFGNATRISYKNRDIYYDYGTRNKNLSIGYPHNTVKKDSIFIISHWDFDHYSGLLSPSLFEVNVAMIIGKNIFPKTQAFSDLEKKFKSKLKYVAFSTKKGGPMTLKFLTQKGNIKIFETGPGQTKKTKNSNKAELILRIKQSTHVIYLTGDSMWQQLLVAKDQKGENFFDQNSLKKDMLVIPHHGGNAGSFSQNGFYQRILNQANHLKFAISVDPNFYKNKIPNTNTISFFHQKCVSSTMPILNCKSSTQIQDVTL